MIVPSTSDPLPTTVTESVGRVIVILFPALAVGGWLAAAFTVTRIVSVPVAPWLSVTINWNTYTPATVSPLTPVEAALADPKVTAAGPLTRVHP